ncbi:MAG: patatin-like phospholipase family protein [Fibrobacterota bacterium]
MNITRFRHIFAILLILAAHSRCDIYLVLSGGGTRGLAHIGVIQALEENNIQPDMIIATSMGAIVGGLYASGYTGAEIAEIARNTDLRRELRTDSRSRSGTMPSRTLFPRTALDLSFSDSLKPRPRASLLDAQMLYTKFSPLILPRLAAAGNDFDSLPVPIRIVATDLVNGGKKVFSRGNLVKYIKASSAVPLAFIPVWEGNTLLVDGGVTDNIPVPDSLPTPESIVIASDATNPLFTMAELTNPVSIGLQVVAHNIRERSSRSLANADIIIRHDSDSFQDRSAPQIIQDGYEKAREILRSHRAALSRPRGKTLRGFSPAPVIERISVRGNTTTRPGFLKRLCSLSPGDTLDSAGIEHTISAIYRTGLYRTVNLSMEKNTLFIDVREDERLRLTAGGRADTYYSGEVFLSPEVTNILGLGARLKLYLQYGRHREKYSLSLTGVLPISSTLSSDYALQGYISSKNIFRRRVSEKLLFNDSAAEAVDTLSVITYEETGISKVGMSISGGIDIENQLLLLSGIILENSDVTESTSLQIPALSKGSSLYRTLFASALYDRRPHNDQFPLSGGRHQLLMAAVNTKTAPALRFNLRSHHVQYLPLMPEILSAFFCADMQWQPDPAPLVYKNYLGGGRTKRLFTPSDINISRAFAGIRENRIPFDNMAIITGGGRVKIPEIPVYISAYADYGYAWNTIRESVNTSHELRQKASWGVESEAGIATPLGPIRISWSKLVRNRYPEQLIENGSVFRFSAGYNF